MFLNGKWEEDFPIGDLGGLLVEKKKKNDVITVIYKDRCRIIKLNGETLKGYVFDDTESFIKKAMELARKYPDADIVEEDK